MKSTLTSAAGLALAVALTGCGQLEAEATSKHICVEQSNVANVPGVPAGTVVNLPQNAFPDVPVDVSAAVPDPAKKGIELHMFPLSFSLGSTTGTVDFSGVETLTITVLAPLSARTLPPVVFRYERGARPATPVTVIEAKPESRVDLAPYLEDRKLRVSASFTGSAPQQSWTATLEICTETRVTVNYWDQITG